MSIELLLRILLGGILGGIIGLERKKRFKYAGFKTHFLVGLGSALIMVVSQYGFSGSKVPVDPSRIAAQVVSGIGFLGAGTIIINKGGVKGLTTAAGLWVTSAIGLTIGCGLYDLAVGAVLFVLIGLETRLFLGKGIRGQILIRMIAHKESVEILWKLIEEKKGNVVSYELKQYGEDGDWLEIKMRVRMRTRQKNALMKEIEMIKGIESVKVEYNNL
ncbi:MAG: MgtC/SapB family protein [Cellulosilyticaceae bacterium]